jgi:hypothetical protein
MDVEELVNLNKEFNEVFNYRGRSYRIDFCPEDLSSFCGGTEVCYVKKRCVGTKQNGYKNLLNLEEIKEHAAKLIIAELLENDSPMFIMNDVVARNEFYTTDMIDWFLDNDHIVVGDFTLSWEATDIFKYENWNSGNQVKSIMVVLNDDCKDVRELIRDIGDFHVETYERAVEFSEKHMEEGKGKIKFEDNLWLNVNHWSLHCDTRTYLDYIWRYKILDPSKNWRLL